MAWLKEMCVVNLVKIMDYEYEEHIDIIGNVFLFDIISLFYQYAHILNL